MNIGIIGTGIIAGKIAEAVNNVDGAVLYAVSSRTFAKARAFAEKYNVKEWYEGSDDFYKRDKIDLVYIATPNPYHYSDTIKALEMGKAVLCEKPFALNSKEAGEMIALAESKNLLLVEAMWTKYFPAVKMVKSILDDGSLGEITHIQGDLSFPLEVKERLYRKEMGGGALYDLGIYPVSMAHYFLGKPDSVVADSFIGESGVDLTTSVILSYKDGKRAVLNSSIIANSTNEFIINCRNGWVRLNGDFMNSPSISLFVNGKGELHKEFPRESSGYEYQIEGLLADFNSGLKESLTVTHRDTLEIMEIMDKIRNKAGLNA